MLVEASSANDGDLLAAVQYAAAHANVVSMSWGGGEFSGETAYDSDFDKAGRGVSSRPRATTVHRFRGRRPRRTSWPSAERH